MDPLFVSHTISKVRQYLKSTQETPFSSNGFQQFDQILEGIDKKFQEANRNNSKDTNVLNWLKDVKGVVNDLNDRTEDLRHNKDSATAPQFMRLTQTIWHRHKVKNAVADKLNALLKAADRFKALEEKELPSAQEALKTEWESITKQFENIEAVGRENSKKDIIDRLMNGDRSDVSVDVFTIVGVAGIGKTKLARLVCEDKKVKAYFKLRRWVDGTSHDVESFVEEVAKEVNKGKRFLVVVDNLRIEDDEKCLEKLKQLRQVEARGAVLITTRFNLVANKVSGRVKTHVLQGLNEKESWSLFKQIRGKGSSSNMDEKDEREVVREDCGGVPMKIITVANWLNCHEGSPVSKADLKKEFLQKLEFGYYDQLLLHQKLCFVYCSLFPQDYEIEAERLIQLWMAEGFLSSDQHGDDEYGLACFNDFVPFVFEETDQSGVMMKRYKMNSLMHELARNFPWDENIRVDPQRNTVDSLEKKIDQNKIVVERASLDVQCGIPKVLFEKAKKLRTILLLGKTNKSRLPHEVKMNTSTCDEIFNTFKSLRVLDLQDLGIKTVPSSIGEVKLLRYLDLSHNNIEKLPSSITKLVHLQRLKLSHCHVLKELPKDFEDLSSLMHLHLDGCLDLTLMPRGIRKMSSLQTLSLFVASKNYDMGGLGELKNLRGQLEIRSLEQLKLSTTSEPEKKYLKEKKHLDCLTLRWDHAEEGKGSSVNHNDDKDSKTLECLEPNQNLRVLSVVGYNGNMFSNWLSSIQSLVMFSLNDCPKCQFLPSLDHLQHLRVLELRRLDSLEFISKNSATGTTFLPSLMELTISDCPELKSWWENEKPENDRPFFRSISKLDIECCPKLHFMPLYPDLNEELILVDSSLKPMWDTMHAKTKENFFPFSKLKSMQIARITETETESPPGSWLENLTSLEKLQIRDCSKLVSLPRGFRCLNSLRCLSIEKYSGPNLEEFKTEWEGLKVTSLQELVLHECPALTSLPESIGNVTSLRKLVISGCINLASLPKGIKKLVNLEGLIIMDCPLLLPRCQHETGDDWPQISHIKNIVIRHTPDRSIVDSRKGWFRELLK